jgi:dTMP kinase
MMVAIEGIDGTGKRTQADLLKARAEREGRRAALFSFPRYGKNPFAEVVARYLNGEFGDLKQVPAELSALLFAGDRYAARTELLEACRENDLVICDRYVASNLAHQASRLPPSEWRRFTSWLLAVEYGVYELPQPALTILLDLPIRDAMTLISRKQPREYTSLKADIHERDLAYLSACREVYLMLAADAGPAWAKIECVRAEGEFRDVEDVAAQVWALVEPRLSARRDAVARDRG